MKRLTLRFSALFAVLLLLGEAWVFSSTPKFWPLSLDDLLASAALLASARLARDDRWCGLLMASWVFVDKDGSKMEVKWK